MTPSENRRVPTTARHADELVVAWERKGTDRAKLRVSGSMRPGWCGKLATGFASRGIAISSGRASSVAAGSWRALFEVACSAEQEPAAAEVRRIIQAKNQPVFATPIVLIDYSMRKSESRGGCLELVVDGEDGVGFLAALLRRLAFLSLFPVELRLETRSDRVHDRLWLRSTGNRVPNSNTADALAARLDALVRRG